MANYIFCTYNQKDAPEERNLCKKTYVSKSKYSRGILSHNRIIYLPRFVSDPIKPLYHITSLLCAKHSR
ncbi:hypothetical protein HZQ11_09905 [Elizabethkingia anophelis]|uniref:hypothetical protein n=1 Tax=Elizabethkingia TaxID=308865 RepID=UPI0012D9859B|nr:MULTISPECIES: hypothetical protein [Elizabethkingia]MCT3644358.1 hypothetical protein [Elizabethkingia anophelis]MCT3650382.1 hypothetical protein [Elizabethkingia anophelis]MCT3655682.1 hypothetical protein [Elizabethkingia anophelis]MCT3658130.1 hypothetical protein [Elizabethkingia anophelis]MCT3665340.1 hypothetical protein [Elizabethkingia anophelis]